MEIQCGKQFLKTYADTYLTKSKYGMYQCPFCGSGSRGTNQSDGAFHLFPDPENTHWKCFSCGLHGDIYDLVSQQEGISLKDSFYRVANLYGLSDISSNGNKSFSSTRSINKPMNKKNQVLQQVQNSKKSQNPPHKDFSSYLYQNTQNLLQERGDPFYYLLERGFTEETIVQFHLGVDQGCITVPYNPEGSYYIKRQIDPHKKMRYLKPKREEAGEEPVFYEGLLYSADTSPIFVVESPFCAISILQEGGKAIAIGGTGIEKLEKVLRERPCEKILLLSLDQDQAGEKTTIALQSSLEALKIPHKAFSLSGGYKDPNEHLQGDSNAFRALVTEGMHVNLFMLQEETRLLYQREHSMSSLFQDFRNELFLQKDRTRFASGFFRLDEILGGGFQEGLYIIGAISTLGKTTFALQIADYMASQGQDILFFSLEMNKTELMAKSIVRETYALLEPELSSVPFPIYQAKTLRELLSGKQRASYTEDELLHLEKAMAYYESYCENLYIFEAMGEIGVLEIQEQVKQHIALTGRKPMVILDYLQILAPWNERASDKQNTDKATLELKRLSRDLQLPILAISSFNRENYTQPVQTASFKESGAIEYSADVLLALQYEGMDYRKGEKEQARIIRIREERDQREEDIVEGCPVGIELKILKNRNGQRGTVAFSYVPRYQYFQERENITPSTQYVNRL